MKELIKEYLRANLSKERLNGYEDCYEEDSFCRSEYFDLYQFSQYVYNNPNDGFLNKDGYLSIMYLGILTQSELFGINILDLLTEDNIEFLLEWKENNKDICNKVIK